MDRYDRYGYHLYPGDLVALSYKNEVTVGKVFAITPKGTVKLCLWDPERKSYFKRVHTRTYKIIKLSPEMGVQTN